MEMLKVTGLTKKYPTFTLKDIDFSVAKGQIVGFIGKNGAGKSTTLKAILNLITPDDGQIKVFGLDIKGNELAIKKRLGVVLGEINFYQQKKIADIAKVTSRFYDNWDEKAFQKYLKEFEIDVSKTPKELSAGMRVKFMVAMALSHQAELLILDEPTSGLDPVSRDDLLNLFQQIVADGQRSILFSTHITTDIEKCADAITYIQGGRLVNSAPKSEFIATFGYLQRPTDTRPLTLEDIMVRYEGEKHYEL